MEKWISVRDQLPPKKGDYLVNCHHEYRDGRTSDYVNIIYFRGKQHWATGDDCITHWMPIPEPPKEVTNERNNS